MMGEIAVELMSIHSTVQTVNALNEEKKTSYERGKVKKSFFLCLKLCSLLIHRPCTFLLINTNQISNKRFELQTFLGFKSWMLKS